eukprot:SAG11_NODE_9249_length_928_cov_2.051870_1_plen_159_part_00
MIVGHALRAGLHFSLLIEKKLLRTNTFMREDESFVDTSVHTLCITTPASKNGIKQLPSSTAMDITSASNALLIIALLSRLRTRILHMNGIVVQCHVDSDAHTPLPLRRLIVTGPNTAPVVASSGGGSGHRGETGPRSRSIFCFSTLNSALSSSPKDCT